MEMEQQLLLVVVAIARFYSASIARVRDIVHCVLSLNGEQLSTKSSGDDSLRRRIYSDNYEKLVRPMSGNVY